MSRSTAYLHVGSPKTGTSYLQGMLWHHRDAVRERGVLLPGRSARDHYLAANDVRGAYGRTANGEGLRGAWGRLAESVRNWDGDVLVTSEWLASADLGQATAAVQAWAETGRDVHVVLTARDLARQLPAEWQQRLKHRSGRDFAGFMRAAQRPGNSLHARLWAAQDYADVVTRWGHGLGVEQVHVVTVPPSGAPSSLLWDRYASVVGPQLADLAPIEPAANTSLSLEQAELLRRLNQQLGDRLSAPGEYSHFVRKLFTNQVLSGRSGTRLELGGPDLEFARERSAQVVQALRDSGVHVVGDLDDLLVPDTPVAASSARDVPADATLLGESLEALVQMIERSADQARHGGASDSEPGSKRRSHRRLGVLRK